MERILGAELPAHLGYEAGKGAPPAQSNRRNGTSTKVLKGQDGELPVAIPRDRDGSFEPELLKNGQTRIDGMDEKIIGLCAAGLMLRDIEAHLLDLYGLKVSPDLISRVTDAVLDEVCEWQSQAVDRMYPIVIVDALRVKIRDADSRTVKNTAVYVALGITRDGQREFWGDPKHLGAGIGPFAVLHNWGQTLSCHHHLHCIVPGAGPSSDGARWIACRPNFFFSVRVLSRLFRRLFLQALRTAFDAGQLQFFGDIAERADPQAFARRLPSAGHQDWVV